MPESQGERAKNLILLVDDDLVMRMLMREALQTIDAGIIEAEDGKKALAFYQQFHPQLIVLDVTMPGMDGFEVCQAIRCLPGGEDVVVVMATGLDDVVSIQRAYQAGSTDFITKPINWPIFSQRIRYLLRAQDAMLSLRRNQRRLAQVQRIAKLGHWELELSSGTLKWSEEVFRIYGVRSREFSVNRQAMLAKVHPEDRQALESAYRKTLETGEGYRIDFRVINPDNTIRTLHEQTEVVFAADGTPCQIRGTVQDISERIQAEEKIRRLAYYDVLTHLPNRQHFKELAEQALALSNENNTLAALLYLDLDRFKKINDSFGHTMGDSLLVEVTKRLQSSIRATDFIGHGPQSESPLWRLGGDEFVILLLEIDSVEAAEKVAKRILQSLDFPIQVQGHEFPVSASIGIACFPEHGTDIDTLLKHADTALYSAKEAGRNRFRHYAERMNARTQEKLQIEVELKKALEREELILHYQPQIEIATGRLVGMEALVRWVHPLRGMVSPGEFIPVAEETGLIQPIGEWVLAAACRQLRQWRESGLKVVPVSVNLSSLQFLDRAKLVRLVSEQLSSSQIPADYLELEVTESAVMQNVDKTIATLSNLKEIGVLLAIDDFGTGYSSMSYLKRFPLDTLKIDRSFICEITVEPRDAAITEALIALGRSLGLRSIAEGVETFEQKQLLQRLKCDLIQGYLISRPLPEEEMLAYLRQNLNADETAPLLPNRI